MSFAGIAQGLTSQGHYRPYNLIAGEFPRITRIVTITAGTGLPAGAVLGRITDSDTYTLSHASDHNGAEHPLAILAEPVEATHADQHVHAYFSGEFNALVLTLGQGHTLASVTTALQQRAIFLRNHSTQ